MITDWVRKRPDLAGMCTELVITTPGPSGVWPNVVVGGAGRAERGSVQLVQILPVSP